MHPFPRQLGGIQKFFLTEYFSKSRSSMSFISTSRWIKVWHLRTNKVRLYWRPCSLVYLSFENLRNVLKKSKSVRRCNLSALNSMLRKSFNILSCQEIQATLDSVCLLCPAWITIMHTAFLYNTISISLIVRDPSLLLFLPFCTWSFHFPS